MAMNVGEKRTAKYSGMEYEYECKADANDASKKRYVFLRTGEDFETISDLTKRAKAYLDQKCVEATQEYLAKQKTINDRANHTSNQVAYANALLKLYAQFEQDTSDVLFRHYEDSLAYRKGVADAAGNYLNHLQWNSVACNHRDQWTTSLNSFTDLRKKLASDIAEAHEKYLG